MSSWVEWLHKVTFGALSPSLLTPCAEGVQGPAASERILERAGG